jgi:hypothetical protein
VIGVGQNSNGNVTIKATFRPNDPTARKELQVRPESKCIPCTTARKHVQMRPPNGSLHACGSLVRVGVARELHGVKEALGERGRAMGPGLSLGW